MGSGSPLEASSSSSFRAASGCGRETRMLHRQLHWCTGGQLLFRGLRSCRVTYGAVCAVLYLHSLQYRLNALLTSHLHHLSLLPACRHTSPDFHFLYFVPAIAIAHSILPLHAIQSRTPLSSLDCSCSPDYITRLSHKLTLPLPLTWTSS